MSARRLLNLPLLSKLFQTRRFIIVIRDLEKEFTCLFGPGNLFVIHVEHGYLFVLLAEVPLESLSLRQLLLFDVFLEIHHPLFMFVLDLLELHFLLKRRIVPPR